MLWRSGNLVGKRNLAAVGDVLPALKMDPRAKRACEIAVAITGLIFFFPTFLIAAIAIKLESRGPIFTGEVHIGHNNRPVRLIKFRVTTWKRYNEMDPPMTRVGRILAQTRIVELPQLINVLRGEMSLFGQRPICRPPAPVRWRGRRND